MDNAPCFSAENYIESSDARNEYKCHKIPDFFKAFPSELGNRKRNIKSKNVAMFEKLSLLIAYGEEQMQS